jgi:integrase
VARARPPKVTLEPTIAEWEAAWQALYPGRRSPETQRNYRYQCATFVRAHGSTKLKDFTPLMAQRWVVQHPGTKRFLSQMFAKAAKAGLVAFNVFDRTEAPVVHREPRMPPTDQQLDALVMVARGYGGWWGGHLADLILFTAFSGLRLKEVGAVMASDILDDGHRLVVRAGKRGPGEAVPRVRTVGVFGPGRGALLRQKPHVGRVWSWRTPDRALSKDAVVYDFRRLADEAGYSGSFHGLRHHCATWLQDRGASPEDIAVQLGHVDRAGHANPRLVRRVYSHPDAGEALLRLDAATNLGIGS